MVMTTECIFNLTKDQVNTLKLQVTSQAITKYNPSRFEVQAGHLWRTVCMARGLAYDQQVKLYILVNGRSRLQKYMELPQGYCGNLLFHATCVEKAGDITCKPLWYAVSKINKAIKKLDDIEYLKSAIDFVETHSNLELLVHGPQTTTSPNLSINSWATLPCYEADFGWGKPIFTGINGIKHEGQTFITPSDNGDGSFLWLSSFSLLIWRL
ncbi:shikimate O-hydroxycinnamoyltransferase-like [Chenopodium quinoa]|uniref:Uncharacterized protein n=1 Tax=Chenopodium quinoa TaxID=63459 RepID=A0A803LR64_CHEQI|nr:shikimate O-hydroxycinnamoyltransferase-like [Chenopodium quinoa]